MNSLIGYRILYLWKQYHIFYMKMNLVIHTCVTLVFFTNLFMLMCISWIQNLEKSLLKNAQFSNLIPKGSKDACIKSESSWSDKWAHIDPNQERINTVLNNSNVSYLFILLNAFVMHCLREGNSNVGSSSSCINFRCVSSLHQIYVCLIEALKY